MTYKDLYSDVISLRQEDSVRSHSRMVSSLNRALRDLFSRRRILKTVRLYARGLTPSLYYKQINFISGDHIIVPLQGMAYSMRLFGEGNYMIRDGEKTNVVQFDTGGETRLVQGMIKTGGELHFYGHTSFMVFDMSVFSEIFSASAMKIPEGGQSQVFDIRALQGDFASFVGMAKDGSGRDIKGCRLYDGRVDLPSDFRGEVFLTYRSLPDTVVVKTEGELREEEIDLRDNTEINIPREYEHPVALLVAYYYTLKEDSALALHFKEEYERLMGHLEAGAYQEIDPTYHLESGWA